MNKFLLGILTSMFVTYLVLQVKIYIELAYQRQREDDKLTIKVRVLPRAVYTLEVPFLQLEKQTDIPWIKSELDTSQGKTQTNIRREQKFLKNLANIYLWHPRHWRKLIREFDFYRKIYNTLLDKLLSKTTCEFFSWHTTYGCDDAAVTGLSIGALWALKTALMQKMQHRLRFTHKPKLQVTPAFGRNSFEVDLKCIFSIRLGNVINVVIDAVNFARKGAIRGG
jgi:hypothetical protein